MGEPLNSNSFRKITTGDASPRYNIDVNAGVSAMDACLEAVRLARSSDVTVQFVFNGVTVVVRPDSEPSLILRDLMAANLRAIYIEEEAYSGETVGPHPNPVLTGVERIKHTLFEAGIRERFADEESRQLGEGIARKARMESKLTRAPAMELVDETAWDKFKKENGKEYGHLIDYAERWARLMQLEMDKGKSLKDVAERTSFEANEPVISNATYRGAVALLIEHWKYGEELSVWYTAGLGQEHIS